MPAPPVQPVYRFAPSPNGFLHKGHAYCALLNQSLALKTGGRLLLRIEDIDTARALPQYRQAMLEDLDWLGLTYETPVRQQSHHMEFYHAALHTLRERGLVYPCFCTRGMIARNLQHRPDWPRDPDGTLYYPGTCRILQADEAKLRMESGELPCWRLDMAAACFSIRQPLYWQEKTSPEPIEAKPYLWGDVILGRRDIGTSYHMAVVLDDALQGVTHIVRGQDLYASTHLHRLLQALLGLPAPFYHHHRLILDESGLKLSKTRQSPALKDLRASGMVIKKHFGALQFDLP